MLALALAVSVLSAAAPDEVPTDAPAASLAQPWHGALSAQTWVGSGLAYGFGLTGTYYLRSAPMDAEQAPDALDVLYRRDSVSLGVGMASVDGSSPIWGEFLSTQLHPWTHTGVTASLGLSEGPETGALRARVSAGLREYVGDSFRLGFGFRGTRALDGTAFASNGQIFLDTWQSTGGYVDLAWLAAGGRLVLGLDVDAAAEQELSSTFGLATGWGARATASASWRFTRALRGDVDLSVRQDVLHDAAGDSLRYLSPSVGAGLRYAFGGGFEVYGRVSAGNATALQSLLLPTGVTASLGVTQRF